MTDSPSPREAFQLERMILFSDAVFAIAITLLVIEIKIPPLVDKSVTEIQLLHSLVELIPKFMGFLVSFLLIGTYWRAHHFLFGYVVKTSPLLLTVNLVFLFTIVLMPFSTGIFGEYSTPSTLHLKAPFIIYVLNVVLTGAVNLWLWRVVGNPARGLTDESLDRALYRRIHRVAIIVPAVFSLAIPVAFINDYAARYVPMLIPLIYRLADRPSRRKSPPLTG